MNIEQQVKDMLLERYETYYRLAYSYVQNQQDALDIVQESSYRAMKYCYQIQHSEYIATWIYRIVVHTSYDFLRKRKKEIVDDILLEQNQTIIEDTQLQLDTKWTLSELLNTLPEKEKTILILRYFEDLKLEDIAKVTGENINTIKARLYRTLQKLRKQLPNI